MAIERITPSNTEHWYQVGLQHMQRYEFAMQFCRDRSVIDIACGCGYGAYCLARNCAKDVVGLDRSEEAITYARNNYRLPNLSFHQLDWSSSEPAMGPVDLVVSFETVEHLDNPQRFIHWIANSLKTNGKLLVSAPNALIYSRAPKPTINPYHVNEPDYLTLLSWLSEDFIVAGEWEQSSVCAEYMPQTQLVTRSKVIKALLMLENLVRKALAKPALDITASTSFYQQFCSIDGHRIFPLIPERAERAEVFLFNCIKRQHKVD